LSTRTEKLERRESLNSWREQYFPLISPSPVNRIDDSRFFGPKTRQDFNKLHDAPWRYPVRFPPGWDNKQKWSPDDGWPPSSFYNNFFYFMETPKYRNAADRVLIAFLKKISQGDAGYFGQGGFGDLGRKIIRPVTPTETITKDYIRYWTWQPWWRVQRYQDLTPDESRNDLQYELYEFNRDLEQTPALYQKWVERREVREDSPIPSLPIGPPEKKFYRKRVYSLKRLAWTAKELVNQTIRRNKVLGKDCSVKFVRSDLKKLVWTYRVKCPHKGSETAGHLCRIKILPSYKGKSQKPEEILGQDFGDLHIGIKCTCPAFKYWGPSYNSWTKGFQYGQREDDGSAPKKNIRHKLPLDGPVNRAFLCKHAIAALTKDWMERILTED